MHAEESPYPPGFGVEGEAIRFIGLPMLWSDETLYSWCGAVHGSCPSPNAVETSRRLFGAPYAALMHDFPSHLDGLNRTLAGELGSSDYLALRHTLLGYFLVAQPAHVCQKIISDSVTGANSSLKFRLGIAASRVGGHHPLKGCSRCFDEQEANVGRAYWRVQHQAPSAMYCEDHDELLELAWDPTTPVHRRGWILPRSGLHRQWRRLPVLTGQAVGSLRRLAHFSAGWSLLSPAALLPERLAATYRYGLLGCGLVTAGGSLRLVEIVRLIRHHYRGLEEFDSFRALRNGDGSWSNLVGNLSRNVPRSCHPMKHLLMIAALFPTWGEFMGVYETSARLAPRPAERPEHLARSEDLHRQFKRLVNNEGLSVSAAGRKVGITSTTAVRWAKVLGLTYTPRAKIHTPERLDEVRRRLIRGDTKSQISRELGLSSIAVDRVVSSEPAVAGAWREARKVADRQAYRDHFASLVAAMRGRTLREIRAVSGSGYAWLYRNDREWLLENLPFLSGTVASCRS